MIVSRHEIQTTVTNTTYYTWRSYSFSFSFADQFAVHGDRSSISFRALDHKAMSHIVAGLPNVGNAAWFKMWYAFKVLLISSLVELVSYTFSIDYMTIREAQAGRKRHCSICMIKCRFLGTQTLHNLRDDGGGGESERSLQAATVMMSQARSSHYSLVNESHLPVFRVSRSDNCRSSCQV